MCKLGRDSFKTSLKVAELIVLSHILKHTWMHPAVILLDGDDQKALLCCDCALALECVGKTTKKTKQLNLFILVLQKSERNLAESCR